MTTDQLIGLSASIGACLAAIATFLTVVQIAKQRKATYRPELVLPRTRFEGSAASIGDYPAPSFWAATTKDIQSAEVKTPPSHPSFAVPTANIGLGAAKDLTLTWSFPIEKLVEELNKRAQRTLTPAYFTLKSGIFSAKSESLGNWGSMWRNQEKVSLDYILPVSFQSEPFLLQLPHAYVVGISTLVALAFREDKEPFPELPKLIVKFKYRDIANDGHEAAFKGEFILVAAMNKGETFEGYFEFRKLV